MIDTQPASVAGAEAIAPVTAPETPSTDQPEQKAETETNAGDETKKIQNALSRKERRIGQLTAQKYERERELAEARQKLSQYEAKAQPATADGKPDAVEFAKQGKSYEDYLESLADWKLDQRQSQSEKKAKEENETKSKNAWKEERGGALTESVEKARSKYSDYQQVLDENSESLKDLPEHIQEAILEQAEDAPDAFYTLVKEDRLDELLEAKSATKAVAILAKAAMRSEALSSSKPVTKAPAPVTASRGTAQGSKPLNKLDGDDLLKWLKS